MATSMSDPGIDAMPALLRKIQEDMAVLRAEFGRRIDDIEQRLDRLEIWRSDSAASWP